MSYGRSTPVRGPFGTTYGHSYNQSGFGQLRIRDLFDQTVVTPAERVGQYAVLGAIGGLATAGLLLLGLSKVPPKQRWPVAGLIALPAAAAVGGVMLAGAEYQ